MKQPTADAEGVIDDQGNICFMGNLTDLLSAEPKTGNSRGIDLRNLGNIRNVILWIANGLDVDRLRLLIDRFPKFFRIIGFYPLHANIEFFEEHCEVRQLAKTNILEGSNL